MAGKYPLLQVALDLMQGERALQIAREAVAGGADWIEAGTPLIKSEGMDIIRKLRAEFPKITIVADMKTMDTGGFETEMVARAGANVNTVMGVTDDGTIMEAIRSGRKYGCMVMVDMMGVEDKVRRAGELEEMGVDLLCLHVSIDDQMMGVTFSEELERISKATSIPVAVAGGITSENAADLIGSGASIIIVGGAITKTPDVRSATGSIKEAITSLERIESRLYRRYTDEEGIREALMQVSAPNVADAMHKKGAMVGIGPVKPGLKCVGPAFTCRTIDGDWAKTVEAIERASPGDVIVIDAGSRHISPWGELATWSCRMRGISGVILDGAARDIDDIISMDFPVFSRSRAPNAGEPKGFGELQVEIECGGMNVRPGDWIIADDSGIMVIPRERAVEIANRALDVKERENRIREEIKRGSTLSEVLELEKWEKKQ
ncbi:MAG TPA: bifunctional hexulose-6-phosphate synthase/ribonuclease regulator [Euryarchaeota archaeon]|nr:MAG: bifunctional hexulose-6-phosphate synthase/ribonuclease regulator [Thermoplasmatales archaeon ex4484_6]RLF69020.1 MAG: bifunctional hexulose-6-phosphate synthase/ribonuclease regulator [Thermoplasmata archaeon]HHD16429.1 bifunctional hexulose-6-phosphate synthase/ribonuclease regulator [Euryarchaeota archaeon]